MVKKYKHDHEFEWYENIASSCKHRFSHGNGEIVFKCKLTKNNCNMEICPLNQLIERYY